jgi:asparagine synthase (glutamine-hydrolysing)
MCGIAGGIGEGTSDIVRKHINLLNHRGPDSQEIVTTNYGLTLGASRLAITDPLPRSNQPMIDPLTGNIIVFNGEIYNFKILKKKLLNLGLKFTTESDTEVLLKLLGSIGVQGISQLEGMYAFAFLDYKKNTLILSRDFLGKKPLYYSLENGKLFFSSSFSFVSKSLKNLDLNLTSVSTYLSLGYSLDPDTLIKNIASLEPGHTLEVDLSNMKINNSFCPPGKFFMSESMSVESALAASILERVDGHANFAISMSGGVDSTLIAMQCKEMGLAPELYSVGFSNSDKARYSEDATAAELVARSLKLNFKLVEMPSPSKIPSLLDDFIDAMEEPNANPTGVSMMALYSNIAKDGHRIVLTGDGSDEIFGGYKRYQMAKKARKLPKIDPIRFRNLLDKIGLSLTPLDKALWSMSHKDSYYSWLYLHQISNSLQLKKLFDLTNSSDYDFSLVKLLNHNFGSKSRISDLMFKDLSIWLSMESNKKLDRVSMWHSIEARSPFQSENMVISGYRAMESKKFKDLDKKILFETFPILRSLPILKNKSGFISPLGHWLRTNPKLIAEITVHLKSLSLFNERELLKLSESPIKGEYEKFKLLWSLIVFSKWARRYNF